MTSESHKEYQSFLNFLLFCIEIQKYLESKKKITEFANSKIPNFPITEIIDNKSIIIDSNYQKQKIIDILNKHQLELKYNADILEELKKRITDYFCAKNTFLGFISDQELSELNDLSNNELFKYSNINYIKKLLVKDDIINIINNTSNKLYEDINLIVNNYLEEYHCKIENNGMDILNKINKKDFIYFQNENKKLELYIYIFFQYFRTNNILNNVINNVTKRENIDNKNIWNILQYLFTLYHASNLQQNKNNIYLLESKTTHFLTCDQPVINLKKDEKDSDGNTKYLELYYPISPNKAIIITSEEKYEKQIEVISDKEIDKLNQFMVDTCEDQVYSDDEQLLKKYFQEAKINN